MSFKKWHKNTVVHKGSCGGALYGMGAIGVLVYYLQLSSSFGGVIWAFVKAVLWPGFLMYHLYGFLGMG